ncbi:MAG: CotH kinase family protein [Granulosicoccus sp.]
MSEGRDLKTRIFGRSSQIATVLAATIFFCSSAFAAPANPVMVSPDAAVLTPSPEFVWNDQEDADGFRMFVYDRSTRTRIHQQDYNRAEVCDGTFCRITPDISLGFSSKHQWRVRAFDDEGSSSYSRLYFSYVEPVPGVVTAFAPLGTIETASPVFTWQEEPGSSSYRLFIADRTARTTLHAVTYQAIDNCNAGICSVSPVDLVLPENSDLYFRVRGRNSGGWGSWPAWADRNRFVYAPPVPNEVPVATDDAVTLNALAQVTLSVLDNDQDIDGFIVPETLEVVTQPLSGIAESLADGTIVYTYTGNAVVSDTFTYRVQDNEGTLSNVATVTITFDSQPGEELELTDLNIIWSGYPLIADDVGNRLFISLGDSYASPSTLGGIVSFAELRDGYTLQINGITINSGDELSAVVQHGDKLPVLVLSDGLVNQVYELVVTNLPLFEIWAFSIVDEPKLPGAWRWANGQTGVDSDIQNLGIEIRGGSSQEFEKKSFGFETRELDAPDESDNVRFLDLRKDDDWIADAAFRDLALVRNIVSHDIYRDMRDFAYIDTEGAAQGQSTIAGGIAEMILNGGYQGLYVVSERVDRKLLGLSKIDVAEDEFGNELWEQVDFSNPGNGSLLYKASSNNAGFYSPETVADDFELKYPDPDDIPRFEPLIELVSFVHYSDDASFVADIGNRVDLASLADFWILRLVTANRDTFKKNYYIARNESQKWFFVPWDFDATFGLRWTGEQYPGSVDYIKPETNQITGRLIELGVSSFTSLVKERWQSLRAELITPASLAGRFSSYFEQMGIDQTGLTESPRNRNLQRWPGTGNLSSGQFEVGDAVYIEQWLTERLTNVDEYINSLPVDEIAQ